MKFCWLALVAGTSLAVLMQGGPSAAQEPRVYTESFDEGSGETALNGTLELGSTTFWATDVAGGSLRFSNTKGVDSVRYVGVEWAKFPGSSFPERTDGAEIAATVTVSGVERAGAGIMAGPDPRTGNYLLFTVGGTPLFRVLQKVNGKVTTLVIGSDAVIKPGEPNRIGLERTKNGFLFRANGKPVVEAPFVNLEGAPVGIGVFGLGRFAFDEVRITADDRK